MRLMFGDKKLGNGGTKTYEMLLDEKKKSPLLNFKQFNLGLMSKAPNKTTFSTIIATRQTNMKAPVRGY